MYALCLATCVALLAGCAKTTLIASAPKDGDAYRNAKTIYVVLKTGETYEMQRFTMTADSIVGTRVVRDRDEKIVEQRASKIEFNEINTIQVIELKSRTGLIVGGAVVISVLGLAAGAALGFVAVVLSAGVW
jgi:hypothetical protein